MGCDEKQNESDSLNSHIYYTYTMLLLNWSERASISISNSIWNLKSLKECGRFERYNKHNLSHFE